MIYVYEDVPTTAPLEWLWNKIPLGINKILQIISLDNTTLSVGFTESLTEQEKNTLDSIIASCPINVVLREISKFAFRSRFTFGERVALDNSTDAMVNTLRQDFSSSEFINLDLQEVSAGLDLLIFKQIITSNRKAEILA